MILYLATKSYFDFSNIALRIFLPKSKSFGTDFASLIVPYANLNFFPRTWSFGNFFPSSIIFSTISSLSNSSSIFFLFF